MKKVVVLGGSGFVGRALCPALAAAGHEVWSISRSPVVRRNAQVNYIDCNYDNVYQLGELYQQADCVLHIACDTTPATSSQQSSLEVTTNLLPTLRLLEYLEHNCHCELIYLSSGGTIYGDVDQARSEEAPTSPISYYGAGKASIELFLRAYQRQTGHAVTVLRPSNLYGPGQIPKQQFGFIPTLLSAIRNGETFRLMGGGTTQRDFLYIDDFTQLCQTLVARGRNENFAVFNAGSGVAVSLNDLVSLAEQITGSPVNLVREASRSVDIRSIVLDCSLAESELGWRAKTGLECGLKETWNWLNNLTANPHA